MKKERIFEIQAVSLLVVQGRNSPIVASTQFLTGQATNKETIFQLRDIDLSNKTVA
jgi:hypothetical protein